MLASFQSSLIFPGAATQGRPEAIVAPIDGGEIITLTAPYGAKPRDTITALFGRALTRFGAPHPEASLRPTLLYFYGNGMCLADCVDDFRALRRRGFNLMVAEYLGYGMSGGKPSEQGVYATADTCFDHLLTRGDIDPKRIVPIGWSIGAAAAIHLASTRPVPRLVVISAFTSMADLAHRLFPFLPTSRLLVYRFDNEQKLRGVKAPIFIAHGTRDGIIPFEMSRRLAAAAAGPVVQHDVNGGDHNDVFDVGGTALAEAIDRFVNEV